MFIRDIDEASFYLAAYTIHLAGGFDNVKSYHVYMAKKNLAYHSGYYSAEVRLRVEHTFNCVHPYFGSSRQGNPTAKEAFELGIALGKKVTNPLEE